MRSDVKKTSGNDIKNLGNEMSGIMAGNVGGSIYYNTINQNVITKEQIEEILEQARKTSEESARKIFREEMAKWYKSESCDENKSHENNGLSNADTDCEKNEKAGADFSFNKPACWKTIKEKYYKEFSILSTEDIPCLYGFAIEQADGGYGVITVFDYGTDDTFLKELDEELYSLSAYSDDVAKINDYINEKAEGYNVTKTTQMIPLIHRAETICGKSVFINLMQIKTNIGKSYSLQMFVKVKTNTLCFGTSMSDIDIRRPLESAREKYQYVNDLFDTVLKSLK